MLHDEALDESRRHALCHGSPCSKDVYVWRLRIAACSPGVAKRTYARRALPCGPTQPAGRLIRTRPGWRTTKWPESPSPRSSISFRTAPGRSARALAGNRSRNTPPAAASLAWSSWPKSLSSVSRICSRGSQAPARPRPWLVEKSPRSPPRRDRQRGGPGRRRSHNSHPPGTAPVNAWGACGCALWRALGPPSPTVSAA
jgi:hypothetical protein